jgi:hypothetical protein
MFRFPLLLIAVVNVLSGRQMFVLCPVVVAVSDGGGLVRAALIRARAETGP